MLGTTAREAPGGPFTTDFYGAGGYYQCIGPVRGAGGRFNGRGRVSAIMLTRHRLAGARMFYFA